MIKDFIVTFGWAKGVFSIFFFIAHFWIYKLYNDRLTDRQTEIDRLAADNREYRERFLELLDKHFDNPKPNLPINRNEQLPPSLVPVETVGNNEVKKGAIKKQPEKVDKKQSKKRG